MACNRRLRDDRFLGGGGQAGYAEGCGGGGYSGGGGGANYEKSCDGTFVPARQLEASVDDHVGGGAGGGGGSINTSSLYQSNRVATDSDYDETGNGYASIQFWSSN